MSTRQAASERGTAESTVQEAEHYIIVRRPLMVVQWLNLPAIPILGQLIQTVFFVLLVFGFFLWFASVAATDQRPNHRAVSRNQARPSENFRP